MTTILNKPTPAFIGASWVALFAGAAAFLIGLWNAQLSLHEKGYYLTVIFYGLFAAVSLQKTVRDQLEHIPVISIYIGLCWASALISVALLLVGLWNAPLVLSAKGFYIMAFLLALFGAIAVQKNVRDLAMYSRQNTALDKNLEPLDSN